MLTATAAAALVLGGACGTDGSLEGGSVDWSEPQELPFGPFDIAGGEEQTELCVQITLHNPEPIFINTVELNTGDGFHHSNWFYVPETAFAGPDGVWPCGERNFTQAAAGVFGGVLFAQSTQATHEVQQFPVGVALKLPVEAKLVAQLHLLNAGDEAVSVSPALTLGPVPEAEVTTLLAGIAFDNMALALPPHMDSRFTIDCDLAPAHQLNVGRAPDFRIYHALAHYHALATRLTLEAVTAEGDATVIYSTENAVGDALGKALDPPFAMEGYTRLRVTCDYSNSRDDVVTYGVGDQEMCTFLAFSDSEFHWAGGVLTEVPPANPMMDGETIAYTNACNVYAIAATR